MSQNKQDTLDRLAELVRVRGELESSITKAVIDARTAGASWGEISSQLGITRQSAHTKYRRAEREVVALRSKFATPPKKPSRRLKAVPDEQSQ